MPMPGGLVEGDTRRRDWAFHPVSGALEMAVAEVGEGADTMPRAVTRALTIALQGLAGGAPTESRVADLCVGDRQFLMRELDRHLGSRGGWLQAACRSCGERFDFEIDFGMLPVRQAQPGYPRVQIDLDGCRLCLRLPTGADQEAIARQPDEDVRSWLLEQLTVEGELPRPVTPELLAAAEVALDSISPAIVLMVETVCPSCGSTTAVELDPYRVLARGSDSLLQEVHEIALHYHWSEADILSLPRKRRLRYLQQIDRARGLAT